MVSYPQDLLYIYCKSSSTASLSGWPKLDLLAEKTLRRHQHKQVQANHLHISYRTFHFVQACISFAKVCPPECGAHTIKENGSHGTTIPGVMKIHTTCSFEQKGPGICEIYRMPLWSSIQYLFQEFEMHSTMIQIAHPCVEIISCHRQRFPRTTWICSTHCWTNGLAKGQCSIYNYQLLNCSNYLFLMFFDL